MNALHTANILASATACPFTATEAEYADRLNAGARTRTDLKKLFITRRIVRNNLRRCIAGGHILAAIEHASLAHLIAVRAVMLIRRGARTATNV